MKKIPLLLVCIAGLLSCNKQKDFDFEINVEHGFSDQYNARLVVTNKDGDVVQVFDMPAGTQTIKSTIPYSASDPETATLDFHLVSNNLSSSFFSVSSSLGVHSGEYTLFWPSSTNNQPRDTKQVILLVDGIPFLGDGWEIEIPGTNTWKGIPNNGDLGLQIGLDVNQSLYLRVHKSTSQNWMEYTIPRDQLQDTMHVSVADFKTCNPYTSIQANGVESDRINSLEMAELSADLQYFTTLPTTRVNSIPTNVHPGYMLPVGYPAPAAYRLLTYYDDGQHRWISDKIFQKGQAVGINQPDMAITKKASQPGKKLMVEVSGNPDVVSANYFFNKDAWLFYWNVEGRPENLKSYKIPDLQAYLPSWVESSNLFANFNVDVLRFDNLDFEQYRSGLPYRSTDVFAVAKSGLLHLSE